MAKIESKRGSKVITTCSMCGGKYTRAGLVGHMRFKHGRDWKAPMIPVEKPIGITEARNMAEVSQEQLPPTPCCKAEFRLVSAEKRIRNAEKRELNIILPIWECSACHSKWEERMAFSKDGTISALKVAKEGDIPIIYERRLYPLS